MNKTAARILLPLLSVAVAGLIAEALLRWVFHAAPLLDLDLYTLDSARILGLRPGVRRRHISRQWDVTIAINQEGLRDRLQPIVSPAPPVLALGDSFAFGWGVNLDQTYLYRLEGQWSRTRPVRVVKAGVPGTGPGDQLRQLEAIQPRYQPQMVLLSFFVGNDFTDVQMGGVNQFEVQDGLLLRRELRAPSWRARLQQKLVRSSHLLQFVRAVQLDFERRRAARQPAVVTERHAAVAARDPWLFEFSRIHLKQFPEPTARGVSQTLEILDQFQRYCQGRNIDFVLMVIPRSIQLSREELAEWQAAFDISDQDLDLDHPQRILREWAERRGVRMLDLLPGFRSYLAEHPDAKLYYYPDAHFNAAGHKLTADLLAEYLAKQGLPRQP